jgi:hypothetical protein
MMPAQAEQRVRFGKRLDWFFLEIILEIVWFVSCLLIGG